MPPPLPVVIGAHSWSAILPVSNVRYTDPTGGVPHNHVRGVEWCPDRERHTPQPVRSWPSLTTDSSDTRR
jgi:hypothetical protein